MWHSCVGCPGSGCVGCCIYVGTVVVDVGVADGKAPYLLYVLLLSLVRLLMW